MRRQVIGCTGSRQGISEDQRAVLREILCKESPTEVHHGSCVSADAAFHDLVIGLNKCDGYPGDTTVVVHPPLDEQYMAVCLGPRVEVLPAKEYLVRNRDIVDCSDLLLACPSNETGEELRSGTWSTIRYARKRGCKTIIIRPSGRKE